MVYQKDSRQDTLIKTKGQFIDESEQTVIASVKTMGANIEHSARNNYRPYLMLYGEVSAVAFPNGKYQSFYPPMQTHVRYEFSDDELSELTLKGLFYDGFKCPEIISDNPNIEIPMTSIARRYLLMDNLYVTLDLTSADIYKTNAKECGYIFADYFEKQIPSKLDTEAIQPEEDVTPTIDEDFAAKFAAEFKDANFDESMDKVSEDFAKEAAQAEHQQSLISAEAQKLLKKSPTAQRQRSMAKQKKEFDKNAPISENTINPSLQPDNPETESHFGDILNEDDEFAAFRRAQAEFLNQSKPELSSSYDGISDDEELAKKQAEILDDANDKLEDELVKKRSAASDASVNISVADNDGETAEEPNENPDFGDAFGGQLDEILKVDEDETHQTMTKDDVEAALKSTTSTKYNNNPQKLVTPDDNTPAFTDNDLDMV